MSLIKNLVGQTAIYGLSSILGRLLNFLLVPLYTGIFAPEEYGVFSVLMTIVAFAMVVLTYGFETAFFHYTNKEEESEKVLSTSFISLLITSLLFLLPYFQSGMQLCFGWWSSREILRCLKQANDIFVGGNKPILAGGGILHRKQ